MRVFLLICLVLNCWFVDFSVSAQQVGGTSYAIKPNESEDIEITIIDNRIKVDNAPIGSKIQIFSVVGIKVKEFEVKQANSEFPLNIAKGYYIVRIGETVRKIAIR